MIAQPGPRLRAGIIGTGFMGTVHANAIRMSGGTIAAVASRSPEAAQAAANRFGAEEASTSPEALIARDDIDVVHICTPNSTHADFAAQVIASGKSVICEKPLATTLEDALELAALSQESGRVAAVPFVYRFYPAVREARARIRSGEAGPLWLLHGSYLQDWLADPATTNWRIDPMLGGSSRAFGDIGVHWCDLTEFVTGHRITRVMAKTARAFGARTADRGSTRVDTEDGATVLFETDRGAVGSLVVSQVSPGRKNRLSFSFDGTNASFRFDQEHPETLWIGEVDSTRAITVGSESLSAEEARRYALVPSGHPQGYQDAFTAFVTDAHRAIVGDSVEGLPTFQDGVRAAQLTDAVLRSAAADEWVSVPELMTVPTARERQR
jgi:predicted dehydrogenase